MELWFGVNTIPDSVPVVETLNSVHFGRPCRSPPASFTLFSHLPTEIRCRIWDLCLRRNRLITIELKKRLRRKRPRDSDTPLVENNYYEQRNHLDRRISDMPYEMRVSDRVYFHTLLSVNKESRSRALAHYRVRLPTKPKAVASPQLYFNPDYDHIYIQNFCEAAEDVLVACLNDVKACDPRNVGVEHLALFDNKLHYPRKSLRVKPSDLHDAAVTSFQEILANLQSLWIVQMLDPSSRSSTGIMDGTGTNRIGFFQSVPLLTEASEFDLLETDPRDIQSELGKTAFITDPRKILDWWVDLEKRFGVGPELDQRSPQRTVSYVCAAAASRGHHSRDTNIRGYPSMDMYLTAEKETWKQMVKRGYFIPQNKPVVSELLNAAGFWIFSDDMLGDEPRRKYGMIVRDLKGQKPSLGLFKL